MSISGGMAVKRGLKRGFWELIGCAFRVVAAVGSGWADEGVDRGAASTQGNIACEVVERLAVLSIKL